MILDSPVSLERDRGRRARTGSRRCRACCARSARPGRARRTVKDPAAALHAAVRRVRRRDVRGPQVVSREGAGRRSRRSASASCASTTPCSSPRPSARPGGLPAALQSLARGDAAPLLHLGGLDVDHARPHDAARRERAPVQRLALPRARCASRGGCRGARTRRSRPRRGRRGRVPATRSAPDRSRPSAPTPCADRRSRRRARAGPRPPRPSRRPRRRRTSRCWSSPGREDLITPLEQARVVAADLPARDAARAPARRPLACSSESACCAGGA